MDFLQEFILALIQALLEWLPVSSEGFIILTAVNFFGETVDEAIRIAIWFHLGTAIAILIKYWRFYLNAITNDRDVLRFLIFATLGTAIVGIPLYILFKEIFVLLTGMWVTLFIGITLLITATLLRFGRIKASETKIMEQRKIGDEIALGAVQGFAILPGISRSGVTMTYLILRGFKKEDAFKMSFVISLPAVVGAIAFDLLLEGTILNFSVEYILLIAFVCIIGFIMMDILLQLAKKISFDKICFILSGITIILVIGYLVIQ